MVIVGNSNNDCLNENCFIMSETECEIINIEIALFFFEKLLPQIKQLTVNYKYLTPKQRDKINVYLWKIGHVSLKELRLINVNGLGSFMKHSKNPLTQIEWLEFVHGEIKQSDCIGFVFPNVQYLSIINTEMFFSSIGIMQTLYTLSIANVNEKFFTTPRSTPIQTLQLYNLEHFILSLSDRNFLPQKFPFEFDWLKTISMNGDIKGDSIHKVIKHFCNGKKDFKILQINPFEECSIEEIEKWIILLEHLKELHGIKPHIDTKPEVFRQFLEKHQDIKVVTFNLGSLEEDSRYEFIDSIVEHKDILMEKPDGEITIKNPYPIKKSYRQSMSGVDALAKKVTGWLGHVHSKKGSSNDHKRESANKASDQRKITIESKAKPESKSWIQSIFG